MDDRRLLFVHAHPDDEASKGAASAAMYADAGARVTLVTATGGEAGEILNPACEADLTDLPAVRRGELEASCAVIGFAQRWELGFLDSGYFEDPAEIPPGVFASTPLDDASRELAAILRQERPQVVVTYPEDGGYPHPDHIMVHSITMRAMEMAEDADVDLPGLPWRVAKVYAMSAFPTSRILQLHDAMVAAGLTSPFEGWLESRAKDGRVQPEPDALIPCAPYFPRRDDALRAHVTQVDPAGFWFGVPRDIEAEVYPYEAYVSLRSDVPIDDIETDLFAGLGL